MPITGTQVEIEGHAIVSVDGMIAAADGTMPPAMRSEADWQQFQTALDRAALVVLGRLGHARHPNPGRRRLVLTRSVAALQADPADSNATLWNPAGLPIAEMLAELGVTSGTIAITGGTGTFDLFEPYFDRFVLAEVRALALPDGIPCFTEGHPRFVLPGAGLEARDMTMIEPGVVQTHWIRTERRPQNCAL
ncbi:dihydrofolate reductase [Devosia sp.]|uniref:dihydrofolate reductase n=1 Tax=Devosia sp. TaxID=1871048 RepID=UPI003A92A6AE